MAVFYICWFAILRKTLQQACFISQIRIYLRKICEICVFCISLFCENIALLRKLQNAKHFAVLRKESCKMVGNHIVIWFPAHIYNNIIYIQLLYIYIQSSFHKYIIV